MSLQDYEEFTKRMKATLWDRPFGGHLGWLGRIFNRPEHSSLHLKSHYFLILLNLLPTGVHVCTPCCLSLIMVPAHPSPHRPHLPWCTYWHLLSIWTAHHSSRGVGGLEQAPLAALTFPPVQLGHPLSTDQHLVCENNYQHLMPLNPTCSIA